MTKYRGLLMIMATSLLVACAAPDDVDSSAPVAETVSSAPTASPAALTASRVGTPSVAGRPATVEKRTVVETQKIAFREKTVNDPSLATGSRKVRTRGVAGVRTLTYEVTFTDGVQTGKRLVRSAVTKAPVTKVTAVGTKEQSTCDPNYSGCVPIASDVDCAGGSGNGPAYVEGPVEVIGDDIYDLDRDGDGSACDT